MRRSSGPLRHEGKNEEEVVATNKQASKQTNEQTSQQKHKQTKKQTNKQKHEQTNNNVCVMLTLRIRFCELLALLRQIHDRH